MKTLFLFSFVYDCSIATIIQPQTAAENGDMRSHEQLESSLEERIEELRHRLRIEAAVVDGAKNVIRTLQSNKTIDKKALQEVSTRCVNNSDHFMILKFQWWHRVNVSSTGEKLSKFRFICSPIDVVFGAKYYETVNVLVILQ